MQVVDASGNMFGYDSITVAGPDGKPKTISTAVKLVTLVRNTSGSTMTKGTIVYINGGSGNKPTIAKALATSDATSAQTYGVVQANIPNNKNGYVVVVGALEGLNTSAYAPGTQLYLSGSVAGEWTSTKQLAPIHLVYVGIVVRQHATQGVVEVKIQNGYELDELHDVQIISVANNDVLQYDSATSLWKNESLSTAGIQPTLSLTTTGTSGAATLVGSTLNIPQYSGGGSSNFSVISLSATNSTPVTGTTANSIVSSILVPANTFGSTGVIDIAARYLKTGTLGNQNVRMYVNTSASLTGATLVANFYNGANTQVGAWRTAHISSNIINFLSTNGVFSSDLASISGTGTSATFNTSVDNYIIFAVQMVSTADSCVLQYHKVLKYA